MGRKAIFAALLLAATTGAWQISALAQLPRADARLIAVGQRQAEMKKLGSFFKTLTAFAKGDLTDRRQALQASKNLEATSRRLPTLWPAGTAVGYGKSKAKPEVWTQRERFNRISRDLNAAAVDTTRAVAAGDRPRVAAQLVRAGGTCRSCHGSFQAKN